jgi:hypothetical protein
MSNNGVWKGTVQYLTYRLIIEIDSLALKLIG